MADQVTRGAAGGVVSDGQIGSDLVVAVPVSSAEHVVGVARASVAAWVIWQRVILAWLLLASLIRPQRHTAEQRLPMASTMMHQGQKLV